MLSKEIAVAVLYREADAFAPAGTRLKIARAAYTSLVPGRAPYRQSEHGGQLTHHRLGPIGVTGF